MGGAYFEVGNITPAAEFNIYVDPEAAEVVLSSGVPVTLLPLDVTHQVLNTPERLDADRRARQPLRTSRRGAAGLFRTVRPREIRLGRRAAARPQRHRLSDRPDALRGPPHQRRDRDREPADARA